MADQNEAGPIETESENKQDTSMSKSELPESIPNENKSHENSFSDSDSEIVDSLKPRERTDQSDSEDKDFNDSSSPDKPFADLTEVSDIMEKCDISRDISSPAKSTSSQSHYSDAGDFTQSLEPELLETVQETKVPIDRDEKHPAYVPKDSRYFLHDSRNPVEEEASESVVKNRQTRAGINADKWDHDNTFVVLVFEVRDRNSLIVKVFIVQIHQASSQEALLQPIPDSIEGPKHLAPVEGRIRTLPIINTISWNNTGDYLLSGSDDRHICISDFFGVLDGKSADCIVFKRKLKPNSNIFVSKFLPFSDNCKVISGFKCGCLILSDLLGSDQLTFSHKQAVYDVLTLEDSPRCFLSLSHDKTVNFYDLRLPCTSVNELCSRYCYLNSAELCQSPLISKPLKFQFPVSAGDVHPIKQSACIALATSDGFVRLFDIRMLLSRDGSEPVPFATTRPLGLLQDGESLSTFDYGPFHITDVQFEPIHSNISYAKKPLSFLSSLPYPPFSSQCSQLVETVGHTLLVNHMYSPVFLYDLNKPETQLDEYPDETDPHGWDFKAKSEESSNSATDVPQNQQNLSRRYLMTALINYAQIVRQRPQENSSNNSSQVPSPPNRTTRVSPLSPLNREYVAKTFAETGMRLRQIQTFRGRKSQRTVIKSACFWGQNYVLAGSECGHMIVWERITGRPVAAIPADSEIVNRIAPHPFKPFLAVCGIDHTIKIIEPDAEKMFSAQPQERGQDPELERVMKLVERNAESDRESLNMGPLSRFEDADLLQRLVFMYVNRQAQRNTSESQE
ncbi:DDB1- and CUL4-associated factor 6 [Cichlidogyrus casuarinus]|uniref:DDB1- and CUL4-associated factor 6 n=1 Tax=Cichlidogyrus casuarinus TaxID=1844966 RepID=A0ABD2PXL0_9PLAT